MGMSLVLWQMAQETLDDLDNNPSIVEDVIQELEDYNEELPEDQKVYLDIDKAWCGIDHLLKKYHPARPSGFLTVQGKDVGKIDLGYGPARYFYPSETVPIHQMLQGVSFERLRDGATVVDLVAAKVYPFYEDQSEEDVFVYLQDHWTALTQFIARTVKQNRGLMLYLV